MTLHNDGFNITTSACGGTFPGHLSLDLLGDAPTKNEIKLAALVSLLPLIAKVARADQIDRQALQLLNREVFERNCEGGVDNEVLRANLTTTLRISAEGDQLTVATDATTDSFRVRVPGEMLEHGLLDKYSLLALAALAATPLSHKMAGHYLPPEVRQALLTVAYYAQYGEELREE